jgi:hypothetical protein
MKCIRCGNETAWGKICRTCLEKFTSRRLAAFEIVKSELGELCATNHAEYVKRVKNLEKEMKKNEIK